MSRAALFTAPAQETLLEFPMTPTRLIFSSDFFNQNQEFLITSRPQQRGFSDIVPFEARIPGNELLYLLQHALMNRRILDNTLASISLCLAGFELRFNQRDDLTGSRQQCNGGGKNFAQ